jgi:HK97 family phage major capsid protein
MAYAHEYFHFKQFNQMSKLKAKIEERKTKLDRVAALEQITKTEKRDWNPAELTEFESLETELREINAEILTLQGQERAAALGAARVAGSGVQGQFSDKEEKDISNYSLRKALLSMSSRNDKMDGIELEMHQEGEREMRSNGLPTSGGIIIPQGVMDRMYSKRAFDPTTGAGANLYGETSNGYVEALRPFSVALQLGAEYMSGMTNDFKIPRENAVYLPTFKETQALATVSNPTMSKASFAPKRATGFMDVDRQLLVQTSGSVEGRMRNQLILGHAQLLDRVAFTGDSASDEPVGILNDSDVPVLAIGTDGGAITKSLIEQLVQRLEEANGMNDNSRWVTSPILKRLLKALTLDSGSGQFVWDRIANTIDGIAAIATTHVPKNLAKGSGTNLTAAILGDFRSCAYAQWGGTEIIVDTVTQALAGNIRYVPIQFVDFHVIQPGHFQVIKDITTA